MKNCMTKYIRVIFIVLISLGSVVWAVPQYDRELTHRLYHEHNNPMEMRRADSTISHMRMAAKAGYNGVLFNGPFDLVNIETWTAKHKAGYDKIKAEAKKLRLALIPPVASGYMGTHDNPMLAEVSPAKGTPFKVAGNMARCASDHDVGLKNGNFESFSGNNPADWRQRNLAGSVVRDGANKHSGSYSLRVNNPKSGARIYQRITVKPYRVYRISAWFRAQDVPTIRGVQFVVEGKIRLLKRRWRPFGSLNNWMTFSTNMPKWTKSVADFNSQDNHSVEIAFWFAGTGYGTGSGGSIWIDDMKVEEVGLYETMRRADCPIAVKSADGGKTYKEGTDYIVDPKCSKFTRNSCYYEGHLKIPQGSNIQNGQTLKVDWYKYSDNYVFTSETNYCLPETWKAVEDDIRRIDDLIGQSEWSFFNHDEWRGAFQSDRCPVFPKARTAGEYMAATMAESVPLARSINNSKRELVLFNDMYDPYHNARSTYHMCRGGTANSWKGLDTSIIIMNWSAQISNSYAFYMGLDPFRKGKVNRQIMNVQGAAEVPNKISIVKGLEAKGGRGVIGLLWVTWYERWNHMALTAEAFKKQGWWGTGPLPSPGVKPPAIESDKPKNQHPPVGMKSLPGSGACQIQYDLPYHCRVDLRMVDAQGRVVRKLVGKEQAMGPHRVNVGTQQIPAGVYFIDLRINGQMEKRTRHVVM